MRTTIILLAMLAGVGGIGGTGQTMAAPTVQKQETSFVEAAALAQDWSGPRLAAFARLVGRADAFAHAVAANETDRMDDGRAAEAAEKAAFLQALRAVAGRPRGGASASGLDAALNAAYARVMAVRDTQDLAWGSVDKAGIRRTERAWLAYRDAFVAFAATLDAPDAANAIKAELTRQRTASLEGFLED